MIYFNMIVPIPNLEQTFPLKVQEVATATIKKKICNAIIKS